jgi:hypothetical protein
MNKHLLNISFIKGKTIQKFHFTLIECVSSEGIGS